jgi:hypothetical protein
MVKTTLDKAYEKKDDVRETQRSEIISPHRLNMCFSSSSSGESVMGEKPKWR